MKYKRRQSSYQWLFLQRLLCLFVLLTLTGCISPIALNRAVIAYDEAVTDSISQQLLVNIVRAHYRQPVHFTGVSNIAATFTFVANAGAIPSPGGLAGATLMPIFGGSLAESPTISIVPIEGEEFTQRLLTPFPQSKLTLLLRQHYDVDMLLRMMAQEVRMAHSERHSVHRNIPSDKAGYEMFRRVVLHFSAIQDHNQLYAEPLLLKHTWKIPSSSIAPDSFQSLQKEFIVHYDAEDDSFVLRKHTPGPILITNYDPDLLPEEEREALNERARDWDVSDIAFDIRAGHYGGEWPMSGMFRLRSFHSILGSLGEALGNEKGYHVEKDARTPPILNNENPDQTLEFVVSKLPSADADLSIRWNDRYYAVNTIGPHARWNRNAFQLLFLLFQMTVTDLPRIGVPSITIAK
ncbi:hypothetical protein [Nitrosomonas ureae]|uniref:Lipoprotein n=1 Tax=Nitrosomonas ureae TaxID=44577 RepID=A0A1H2EKH9_9PROT|nr:hypothetical protein [Nitrosomonas ureae]ALQ50283.1 hypothetical protein ATY38_02975 [Nitrosomonas ureae]SDT95519.1 hypothetical protein SAMN05216406_11353 [Nitrosomonas ureae]